MYFPQSDDRSSVFVNYRMNKVAQFKQIQIQYFVSVLVIHFTHFGYKKPRITRNTVSKIHKRIPLPVAKTQYKSFC